MKLSNNFYFKFNLFLYRLQALVVEVLFFEYTIDFILISVLFKVRLQGTS